MFVLAGLTLFWAYAPGLNGPFVFDDIYNIVDNPKVKIDQLTLRALLDSAFSTHTGPLSRPLSMLSFSLNYFFFGLSGMGFKLPNLVIHFLNSVLIYVVSRKIIRQVVTVSDPAVGAMIAALLWLLHPYNVTSVLYVVQRMAELATFFGLLAIFAYVTARLSDSICFAMGWIALCLLFSLLAVLSKENMVVLIPLLAFVEWIVFRFASIHESQKSLIPYLKAAMLVGIFLFVALFAYEFSEFQKGYNNRSFTMSERLLTEFRIFWMYLRQVCVPDINSMQLFHDEIELSESWVEPLSTIFSALALGGWFVGIIICRNKMPIMALGMGWFVIGHLVESTIVPLEIMHEHRNYFPSIGLVMVVGVVAERLVHRSATVGIPALTACLAIFAFATHHRATDWESWETLVITEAEKNPFSSRSQYEAGRYYYWRVDQKGKEHYKLEDYEKARNYFERGYRSNDSSLLELAALLRLNDALGMQPEPSWVQAFLSRIGNVRINPNDLGKLLDLYMCRINGYCQLDAGFLSDVASVAEKNDRLPNNTKAAILAAAASLALKEGRTDFALYYVLMAIELDPHEFEYFKLASNVALITKNKELLDDLMTNYGGNFLQEGQVKWIADIKRKISGQDGSFQ